MNLFDLFSRDDLDAAIAAKHVRMKVHRSERLAILNYTAIAQYERAWTPVTLACRGIIFDQKTYELVAMPFGKFFNYGERNSPPIDLDQPVVVTDKLDGSLGIGYRLPSTGQYAIATRGSFQSRQAHHASRLWHVRYNEDVTVPDHITPLFEIIYPDNRVVCDYHGLDDLVLIGAVDMTTGKSMDAKRASWAIGWTGPVVQELPYRTFAEAFEATPRDGAEGIVVHFPATDTRVKIKQSEYVALHRLITGTTSRTLWEYLAVNANSSEFDDPKLMAVRLGMDPARVKEILALGHDWLNKMLAGVPDEFYGWVQHKYVELRLSATGLWEEIRNDYKRIVDELGGNPDRKTFALATRSHRHFPALMGLYQDRSINAYVWRETYPPADEPVFAVSDDVL